MLDDAALGQDAAGADRAEGKLAQALGLGRRLRLQDLAREDALRQVVQALEPLASRDDELAVVPQELEHPLRRLPAPHLALARGALEVPRAERTSGTDLVQHMLP